VGHCIIPFGDARRARQEITARLLQPISSKQQSNKRNTNYIINIMNTLEMKGNWNIAKGKLKQKYAKLTDQDLTYTEGKQDELVGRIQKRTGETKEAVEKAINESFADE
jgi:uncharacterized protein YjbJ (UPF0337 family)